MTTPNIIIIRTTYSAVKKVKLSLPLYDVVGLTEAGVTISSRIKKKQNVNLLHSKKYNNDKTTKQMVPSHRRVEVALGLA